MITELTLNNFRNLKKKKYNFSRKTTVIIGPNASGKTNILEAVRLLSSGKSFKANLEEEMISHRMEIARISALIDTKNQVENTDQKTKLEVLLTRGQVNIGTTREEKVPKKKLLVNGISRRVFNFSGVFRTVLFGPEDLDLVTESPSVRRKFLDSVLSQINGEYRRAIVSYEKGLRRRNRILFRIREEGLSRSNLLFWDKLLIKNGDFVSGKRRELIEFIAARAGLQDRLFDLEYDNSAISQGRLEQYAREEVAAATTLVGPHRDDFIIKIKIKNSKRDTFRELSKYGSRGEQRMGVLWLKLAELAFIKDKTKEDPTLLLDDIFSELDHQHREVVMKVVGGQQTIITTADPQFIEKTLKVDTIKLAS